MDYHEFLRTVWSSASRGPVTSESYDVTLAAALQRYDGDLYDEACNAVGTVASDTGKVQFRTPQLLHFLERSWKVRAAV